MSISKIANKFSLAVFVVCCLFTTSLFAADSNSPEDVVNSYYKALKARKFEQAYPLLTDKMKDGRTAKQYAADWQNIVNLGSVILHEYGVSSVKVEGDKAQVEAWTRASDIFNTKGIVEKEVDHLIKVNGQWLLDATEVSME